MLQAVQLPPSQAPWQGYKTTTERGLTVLGALEDAVARQP